MTNSPLLEDSRSHALLRGISSSASRIALTLFLFCLALFLPAKASDAENVASSTSPAEARARILEPQLQPLFYIPMLAKNLFPGAQFGIWISPEEVRTLPASGPAWENVYQAAQQDTNRPNIKDQVDDTDVNVLAKALVYARSGQASYRNEVRNALMAAIGTENGGSTLALGRNLVGYIVAADLIILPAFPDDYQRFRSWLAGLLTKELDGRTLQSTHEDRANNWGTHAGAARAAIALYLGDEAELARTAQVFKGWLGDRDSYAAFKYGELWWQCDPANPVGINPVGCTIDGHPVDGVIPDDQRRGGEFEWPPPKETHVWGAMQGAVVQAQLLHRAGYQAWEWEDRALLRAASWLHEQANYPAEGDDEWQPWLINAAYGVDFPAETPARPGKNFGWTDWTHS
jgi:hypothetical protein